VALTLAAAGGAAALGIYSGNNSGAAAVAAGALAGALTGATGLGVVGLMADIGGGIMSSKNVTPKMALAGAVVGAGVGAFRVRKPRRWDCYGRWIGSSGYCSHRSCN
jgi:hypothetical protein